MWVGISAAETAIAQVIKGVGSLRKSNEKFKDNLTSDIYVETIPQLEIFSFYQKNCKENSDIMCYIFH